MRDNDALWNGLICEDRPRWWQRRKLRCHGPVTNFDVDGHGGPARCERHRNFARQRAALKAAGIVPDDEGGTGGWFGR